jgi:membrane protein
MNAFERPLRAADRLQRRWAVLAVPVAVWSKFNDDQAGNLAALIAYFAFAAIFPLLLVLVTVLDIVLSNDQRLRDELVNSAVSQYPVIGPEIQSKLGSIPGSGVALGIGIVLLLLGARGVAGAMQNALCEIWGIKKADRPGFPWSQLWQFALVLTVGLGFIVTTSLSGVVGGVGNVISGTFATVVTALISLVLNVGVFWLSFKIATGWQVPWRNLWLGSAVAAVCWQILQLVGGYVVSHQLHRASQLYGTFGIVLGLLAWLFLQAELTLYAAEADVVLTRRLWPVSVLPTEPDQSASEGEPAPEGESAGPGRPAPQESRGKHARPDDRSSLKGEPGPDGQADAGGRTPVPPPRGEPSASDKKAGSAR